MELCIYLFIYVIIPQTTDREVFQVEVFQVVPFTIWPPEIPQVFPMHTCFKLVHFGTGATGIL